MGKTMIYDGIHIYIPNDVIKETKEYYISYNSSYIDYDCDTTALVITLSSEKYYEILPDEVKEMNFQQRFNLGIHEGPNFFVLKGNHSKQLNDCKTLKECVEYVLSNKKSIHKYSQDIDIFLKYFKLED